MIISLISAVCSANSEIVEFFREMTPGSSDRQASFPSPGRIEALTKQLAKVGRLLACLALDERKSLELESEILLYKANLERLQQILPDVHRELHTHRRRLEEGRTNLQAVRAWAEALKDTF